MRYSQSEQHLSQEPGHATDRQLLVGVDAPLTPATQYALHQLATFFAPDAAHLRVLVLTVIPLPVSTGRYAALYPLSPTREERAQAEEALRLAREALSHGGLALARIETLIRVGAPADELAAVARQRQVDCLIIGSQGNAPAQRLRRVFAGSTSRSVLRLAPCPVMIMVLPRSRPPKDLVAWYEAAIRHTLADRPNTLVILTAREAAGRFLPLGVAASGRKARKAAARALERLAHAGVLSRRDVAGEVRYVND
jgi:nucleotide-binding universal stress UspA family protein